MLFIPQPQPDCETAASASGARSAAASYGAAALYFAAPGRGPAGLAPDGTAPRLVDRVLRALGIRVERPAFAAPYTLGPDFPSPRVRRILKDNAPYLLNKNDRFIGREPPPLDSLPAAPARGV